MYKRLVLRLARIFGEFQECNDDLICRKTNTFKPSSDSLFQHDGAEFSIHRIVTHYKLAVLFRINKRITMPAPSAFPQAC